MIDRDLIKRKEKTDYSSHSQTNIIIYLTHLIIINNTTTGDIVLLKTNCSQCGLISIRKR